MSPLSWSGGPLLLVLLLGLLFHSALAVERHYYIAAVNITWNYNGHRSGPVYNKVVFREYDAGFKQAKAHPPSLGLLGPTLRGQVGDVIVVTFKNMANKPYSIHPHGIAYGKQSEGSLYFDNTSLFEKEDDQVFPGQEHTYYWELTAEVSPTEADPPCLTYTYISHYDIVRDYNTGLIGTLLVCKNGSLGETGEQIHFAKEFSLLFGVFDESKSWFRTPDDHPKYTINGYMHGTIPELMVCAHTSVSWHLLGMSSERDLFSVHFNGQVMLHAEHRVSSVGLASGTATSASMTTTHPGRWLVSSYISRHMEAGMHGYLNVESCKGVTAPVRKLTSREKRQSQEWTYYIAAEEDIWDYAPSMPEYIDGEYRAKYLRSGPDRIGKKYRKAFFTQYKDETFKEREEKRQRKMERGILGPVIRAQIRDLVKIVFKNMASRPYSIYPHGLTIKKSEEGASYPEGGNQTNAVLPGQTHTYVWEVWEEDEPTSSDPRCLTRMYHSAVDPARDIASGLIGPLLICKSQSLSKKNVQLKADKEQQAVLSVFDENKSWYIDKNINTFCGDPSKVNKEDPEFYNSNVMHSINGYIYDSGQVLGFCNEEIVTWHMSSIGAQDHIEAATFYGHSFELNDRVEDILSLFPMTGETITMNMNNIGHWLLASLNPGEASKGVRLKFKDLECYRDYFYDYTGKTDADDRYSVNTWRPEDLNKIREEEEKRLEMLKKNAKETPGYIDEYTEYYVDALGLRSFKNKSRGPADEVELLDLSLFDYTNEISPPGNTNDNQSLSPSTASQNLTHPDPESNKKATNLSLAVDEVTTVLGSFNDSRTKTTGFNESTYNLASSVEPKLTNDTVASEASRLEVEKEGNVGLTLRMNSTTEVSYLVESAANGTLLNQLNGSSEQAHREIIPDPTGTSHMQNTSAELSGDPVTGIDLFTYTVHQSKPSSNGSQVEMDDTDKEDFVLLDSGVGTSINNNKKIEEVDHPPTTESFLSVTRTFLYNILYSISTDTTLLDEGKKSIPENTTLASVNNTVNAENRMCNLSCPKSIRVTAPGVEIDISNINNRSLSLEMSGSNEQENYRILSEETSHTAAGNQVHHKMQLENVTSSETVQFSHEKEVHDDITKPPSSDHSASSMELSSESKEDSLSKVMDKNITFSSGSMNLSSSQRYSNTSQDEGHIGDAHMGNISHTASGANASYKHGLHSDSNKDMSESREKVAIYLKNNSKEAILTVSLDHQKEHWGYDGRHQLVPLEIPDHVTKYTKDESRPSVDSSNATRKGQGKKPKRKKWPAQSRGMKTRKRKVYKPNPRSGFSPRGHGPHWFVPRGSRPITSAEDLSTNPIIIGLPRRDFNDYELYIPNTGDDVAYDFPKDSPGEEYEYVDYKDPYSQQGDFENIDEATKYALKLAGDNVRAYFIAAEEVEWDYEGYGQRRQERANIHDKPTQFTKVVFRNYLDSAFTTAEIRGEVEEHLGLLGPIIKAEVDQTIMVVFKNLASRPYSLHAHGVSYSKQMEGLKYDDESPHWYKFDNEVQPQETYTYIWKADSRFGPKSQDSDCRTWAYYSGVNPEKDINSGLIGPLLVCRKGTLDKNAENMREFVLLFMTFDETKSWYYDKNVEKMQRKYRRASKDPSFIQNIQFPAINGIIFSLKGLRMYTDQLVRLHLMNMGSPKDVHSISFHGQTFLDRQTRDRRHGVYQLLPGSFADLEMWPSKPGLWQLETEVGDLQLRGMQTLFLVIDNSCGHPLGLSSQSVKDSLITASDYTDEWKPHLARLHNSGRYNAWSSEKTTGSWIQVDFQRPVVISRVATQGARQYFHHHYVEKYAISYSTDKRKWTFYRKGINRMIFTGNKDAIEVKENTFFPPLIGRFIRLYPIESFNRPTVRMEFYGCELDGCSVPLGMESGRISNHQITASSTASSWFSGPWHPWLARLNKLGAVNAWQAKTNNMQQWLQVELKDVKKITGIVIQGAKSLGSEMYVTEYTLEYSKDGKTWTKYKEDEDDPEDVKVFPGNVDNNGHVKNHIYPPIFSRFIRIIPRSWQKTITMRIELLGCDFE